MHEVQHNHWDPTPVGQELSAHTWLSNLVVNSNHSHQVHQTAVVPPQLTCSSVPSILKDN